MYSQANVILGAWTSHQDCYNCSEKGAQAGGDEGLLPCLRDVSLEHLGIIPTKSNLPGQLRRALNRYSTQQARTG